MKKTKSFIVTLVYIVILAGLLFAGWYFYVDLTQNTLPQLKESTQEVAQSKIFTPEPLQLEETEEDSESSLNQSGVIRWTNKERTSRGLSKLTSNSLLAESAQLKAQDMLDKQYFAHTSPTGEGMADLVDEVGYDYLIIGENLATGNFASNKALVEAWMDSPGHRENILKEGYTQIGVSVIKGQYQGKKVWMAVQHFGTPRSTCNPPSDKLKTDIENNEFQLSQLKIEINDLKGETDSSPGAAARRNSLVEEYNRVVKETKQMTQTYNQQVNHYNQCLNTYDQD